MRSPIGIIHPAWFALIPVLGCISQPPTTVELVNSTSFDVRPDFYTSDSATQPAALFVGGNLRTDFTDRPFPELRSGQTASLTLNCDEIESMGVDTPILFDALQLTVTSSLDQIFLRQGSDFECGTRVRFVYYTENGAFRVRAELP